MTPREELEANGFAIQRGVISADECERMAVALDGLEATIRSENSQTYGLTSAQVTLFNVHVRLPELFLDKIDLPEVMETVGSVLSDSFLLSNFNASRSGPDGGARVHIDSRVPMRDFANTLQIVAMLCIDDFTATNGSTIVWPGSHLSGVDPRTMRGKYTIPPGHVAATAPRGSVIYMLGQTWHDVGANRDGSRRWGIIAYYSRWWIKPTFDFTACPASIYNRSTARQRVLLGYNSRPPLPGEGRIYTMTRVEDLPERL